MIDLLLLEKKIGHRFKHPNLLKEALTHRSYLNENPRWPLPHNERLEYLGDAVLELSVSEGLFKKFPKSPEGQLTALRAALVNYQSLSMIAKEIRLGEFVLMSRGESRDQNKAKIVILANTFEALLGAIYLDGGLAASRKFVQKFVLPHLRGVLESKSYKDPKSELQEVVQEKLKITPNYKLLEESGPAHLRNFRMGVYFDEELIAEGEGASKQEAETDAARKALTKMQISNRKI